MEYYESNAYGKVCACAFGLDLKQVGMMAKEELDFLLEKSVFDETAHVLEIGCGAGQTAAYISEKTSARFTCIDVDKKSIAWASEHCKGNDMLQYHVMDVRDISKITEKFTKILAIDSLYFVSGRQLDSFYESLRKTLQNLYARLEDGGELIVSWSEPPVFTLERNAPECTQLGRCFNDLGYSYTAYDFTECEIGFWNRFKEALIHHEKEFTGEGAENLFTEQLKETNFMLDEVIGKSLLYRNLFIVQK